MINHVMMNVFEAYTGMLAEMGPCLQEVEDAIRANLPGRVELVETINRHVIASGGKRLRPLLMIICARLSGYRGSDFANLATVIEYLHSATLLHDDVLDGAAVRRGNPSANATWGNAAAVLSGDYLYSRAFSLLVEHYSREITLLMCGTAMELVQGEVMELTKRRKADLTAEEYREIIALKTASLIAASCKAGALLGGAPKASAEALYDFGCRLGLAFQVTDDVLDYIGDTKEFGKVPGSDLREGTVTLPLIKLMASASDAEREWLGEIIADEEPSGEKVAAVIDLVRRRGADRESYAAADLFISEARGILEAFEDGPYRRMLSIAADYIVSRRV